MSDFLKANYELCEAVNGLRKTLRHGTEGDDLTGEQLMSSISTAVAKLKALEESASTHSTTNPYPTKIVDAQKRLLKSVLQMIQLKRDHSAASKITIPATNDKVPTDADPSAEKTEGEEAANHSGGGCGCHKEQIEYHDNSCVSYLTAAGSTSLSVKDQLSLEEEDNVEVKCRTHTRAYMELQGIVEEQVERLQNYVCEMSE
eukprot:PhF_6_TR21911/c0_g1_i1/m.31120